LFACQSPSGEKHFEKITREFEQTVDQVTRSIGKLAPDSKAIKELTTEEVEKLFVFEYLVSDAPPQSSTAELQETLTKLGQERWECFHIERTAETLRIFCKRRPKTYLRYIPRVFM